jgi:hypothetical protein
MYISDRHTVQDLIIPVLIAGLIRQMLGKNINASAKLITINNGIFWAIQSVTSKMPDKNREGVARRTNRLARHIYTYLKTHKFTMKDSLILVLEWAKSLHAGGAILIAENTPYFEAFTILDTEFDNALEDVLGEDKEKLENEIFSHIEELNMICRQNNYFL